MTASFFSRYSRILSPGAGFRVFALRRRASIQRRAIRVATALLRPRPASAAPAAYGCLLSGTPYAACRPDASAEGRYSIRAGLLIQAAPADPRHNGLAADAQRGEGIDPLPAPGNRPALPGPPDKNRSPASARRVSRAGASHQWSAPDQPSAPRRAPPPSTPSRPLATDPALPDPVRMEDECRSQRDDDLRTLDRSHHPFRLECRPVVLAGASGHSLLVACGIKARRQLTHHLPGPAGVDGAEDARLRIHRAEQPPAPLVPPTFLYHPLRQYAAMAPSGRRPLPQTDPASRPSERRAEPGHRRPPTIRKPARSALRNAAASLAGVASGNR